MDNPLADVELEGQKFDEEGNLVPKFGDEPTEEKETPTDSPPENKPEEDEEGSQPSEEEEESEESSPKESEKEDVPFHEHPRWKEVYGELKELRDFKSEVQPVLESLRESKETKEVPTWFKTIYGEDENAWNQYREYSKQEKESLKSEILGVIQEQQNKTTEESKKYDEWVNSELKTLGSEIGEDLVSNPEKNTLRNKILKTALEWAPVNTKGEYDFKKAYKILKLQDKPKEDPKPKSDERKKLASLETPKSQNKEEKNFMTPSDLRGKSVYDMIHEDE